jgi:3,4-dihydroxy 2-butanone 4-phosphate synthase/GTP cyclohydrolase II
MIETQRSGSEDVVFATVEEALDDLRAGRCVIVADSRDPESEGDLLVAAQKCTPEVVNFMATEASGIVFLCLSAERVEELGLRSMAPHGDARSWKHAMTVSIEARHGVTTGISAHDRARTIQVAIDPASRPQNLVRPGHVFPLTARSGGVLDRAGRTEAHVDLARLAGFVPAGVAVEIVTDDGSVAALADLAEFARRRGLRMITVGDVVRHRWRTERVLERGEQVRLRTRAGEFGTCTFVERPSGARHVALVQGELRDPGDVLLSVHAECFSGHVFSSVACDCATRLEHGLQTLGQSDRGALVYVRPAAVGELACDTTETEHVAAVTRQILAELEIPSARIRTADGATASLLAGPT